VAGVAGDLLVGELGKGGFGLFKSGGHSFLRV
jgi:hypothetical protein